MPMLLGELLFTQCGWDNHGGKLLRPFACETYPHCRAGARARRRAFAIYPNSDSPDFNDRVVVLLYLENLALIRPITSW